MLWLLCFHKNLDAGGGVRKKRFLCFFSVFFWLVAGTAFAYKIRCDKQQARCTIESKRLHVGDYIGVFNERGSLEAIGRVTSIKGLTRSVKMKKIFSKITSRSKALLIKDNEAKNPEEHFRVVKVMKRDGYGVMLGLVSMGVGRGITAFELAGLKEWNFRRRLKVVGRGFYMMGSGTASSTGDEIASENVRYSALAALGGVSSSVYLFNSFSLRGEVTAGLCNVSLTAERTDAKDLVDGQVFPGMGAVFRFGVTALFKGDDYRPFVDASFLKIQNSFNTGIGVGLYF